MTKVCQGHDLWFLALPNCTAAFRALRFPRPHNDRQKKKPRQGSRAFDAVAYTGPRRSVYLARQHSLRVDSRDHRVRLYRQNR
jgi:hypothetical protein